MNKMNKKQNLIWIDLEMTGLDPDTDLIIEIATIITDNNLNILAEGPSLAIHQDKEVLQNMNEWCIKQHSLSGLTQRVISSNTTTQQAEKLTLEFLAKWVQKGMSPMCGNSICQDRRFLAKYMPTLEEFFHYRHIDVSTIKELNDRWYEKPKKMHKESSHLALEDTRDSINELKYYRKTLFRNS